MLSNMLKQLREQHSLSQAKVAEQLHIPKGTYVTYEYGTREPNIEMINKLADFYSVTTDYLLGRKPDEPNVVDVLARESGLTDPEIKLLLNYINLPQNVRRKVFDFLRESI